VLHNRGGLFTLNPDSPNVIAPHKRPYNTLSAGFVMKDGEPLMTILLMGGDMQAQGHAQALVNIIDLGANLQAATDMVRFRHNQVPNVLQMESELYKLVGGPLSAMGHNVQSASRCSAVGGHPALRSLQFFSQRVLSSWRSSVRGVRRRRSLMVSPE
jgi:gamma-glutamyltranspeptidase / glutathione hydrolase